MDECIGIVLPLFADDNFSILFQFFKLGDAAGKTLVEGEAIEIGPFLPAGVSIGILGHFLTSLCGSFQESFPRCDGAGEVSLQNMSVP